MYIPRLCVYALMRWQPIIIRVPDSAEACRKRPKQTAQYIELPFLKKNFFPSFYHSFSFYHHPMQKKHLSHSLCFFMTCPLQNLIYMYIGMYISFRKVHQRFDNITRVKKWCKNETSQNFILFIFCYEHISTFFFFFAKSDSDYKSWKINCSVKWKYTYLKYNSIIERIHIVFFFILNRCWKKNTWRYIKNSYFQYFRRRT